MLVDKTSITGIFAGIRWKGNHCTIVLCKGRWENETAYSQLQSLLQRIPDNLLSNFWFSRKQSKQQVLIPGFVNIYKLLVAPPHSCQQKGLSSQTLQLTALKKEAYRIEFCSTLQVYRTICSATAFLSQASSRYIGLQLLALGSMAAVLWLL